MFKDTIKFNLELQIEGKDYEIACGNIDKVHFNLHSYGFDCAVQFWWEDKEGHPLFCSTAIIQSTLTVASPDPKLPEKLLLKGLVTARSLVTENTINKAKETPVLMRLYRIHFKDFAQAVWSQHFPTSLYVDKTMKDVIEAQKSPLINITYDWEVLTLKQPIIALGLGCEGNRASFYSFLMWYLSQTGGIWEYNYAQHDYALLEKKKADQEPIDFDPLQVESILCDFPEPIRHHSKILNGYAKEPKTKEVENKLAYEAMTRDYLLCSPLSTSFEKMEKNAQPVSTAYQHLLRVNFKELPRMKLTPGALVQFKEKCWNEELYYKNNIYRSQSLSLKASATDLNYIENNKLSYQIYQIEAQALLEMKDETIVKRPEFFIPTYPFYVEGKIFSQAGKEEQTTYQVHQDEETSEEFYQIEIPLWENQKIIAPFMCHDLPGQFYFPIPKGERVEVELYFLSAHIKKFKDWWTHARLPKDIQGNRLVFTPKTEEVYTVMHHALDGEEPVFKIERYTVEQFQRLQMKNQGVLIELKEKEDAVPTCFIQMDYPTSLTLTTQNKEKDIVQTIKLEEGSIQITCQGKEGTSSFLQKPDEITIECKKFNLNCEIATIKAKNDFISEANNTKITTQDLAIEGSKIGINSKGSTDIKAKALNLKGQMTTIEGSMVKIN